MCQLDSVGGNALQVMKSLNFFQVNKQFQLLGFLIY